MESTLSSGSYTSFNLEYLFLLIYRFIAGGDGTETWRLLQDLWLGMTVVSVVAVPVLLVLFFVIQKKIEEILKAERERYYTRAAARAMETGAGSPRWQEILELVNSENPPNWRLAIMEADVMLDDLLKRMGYMGDTLGERLQSVDGAKFRTLDKAWEAHRVRNQIAHEGSDFVLTQREARRAVDAFREVFQEHGVI